MGIEVAQIGPASIHPRGAGTAFRPPRPQQQHHAAMLGDDLIDGAAAGLDLHVGGAPAEPPCRRRVALADQFGPKALFQGRVHQLTGQRKTAPCRVGFRRRQNRTHMGGNVGGLDPGVRRHHIDRLGCFRPKCDQGFVDQLQYQRRILAAGIGHNPWPAIGQIGFGQIGQGEGRRFG